MEEEVKATARFGFGWAISSTGSQGGDMEVDDDEGLEMELVWVESEGSFARSEVSSNHVNIRIGPGLIAVHESYADE
jgi:hypothetical protein